ncbi:hypothetical protein QQ045_027598 [Rhodiola kirilowii]
MDIYSSLTKEVGPEGEYEKCVIYFGGFSDTERRNFARVVVFQQGRLPFIYLEVPLDGTNIKGIVYNPIIEKSTSKIKSWAAKCLSYAGRLVLVKHVLSAICSYWMRVLIFPKDVLKKITAICRNFLCSGESEGKRSLVALRVVCQPKECHGLGIKNLWQNNKACLLGQVWDTCLKNLMWIKWMNSYFFKNQSFWEVEEKVHQTCA